MIPHPQKQHSSINKFTSFFIFLCTLWIQQATASELSHDEDNLESETTIQLYNKNLLSPNLSPQRLNENPSFEIDQDRLLGWQYNHGISVETTAAIQGNYGVKMFFDRDAVNHQQPSQLQQIIMLSPSQKNWPQNLWFRFSYRSHHDAFFSVKITIATRSLGNPYFFTGSDNHIEQASILLNTQNLSSKDKITLSFELLQGTFYLSPVDGNQLNCYQAIALKNSQKITVAQEGSWIDLDNVEVLSAANTSLQTLTSFASDLPDEGSYAISNHFLESNCLDHNYLPSWQYSGRLSFQNGYYTWQYENFHANTMEVANHCMVSSMDGSIVEAYKEQSGFDAIKVAGFQYNISRAEERYEGFLSIAELNSDGSIGCYAIYRSEAKHLKTP